MPYPSRRLSPSLETVGSAPALRPSLFDSRNEFIERVSPIGMAAIYFGSFSFAPQDAALSRQALFKLSFVYRYFLQPAGLRISVQRQTAQFSGELADGALALMADLLARQIEGIVEVSDETNAVEATAGEKAQLLLATDHTLEGAKIRLENGQCILEGEVNTPAQKNWAETLAGLSGAKIESRLTTSPIPSRVAERKQPEVDDESLQALVLARLKMVGETESLSLRVKATRGVVLIQGKVRTEALRQRVENLARSTVGMRELRSSITLAA